MWAVRKFDDANLAQLRSDTRSLLERLAQGRLRDEELARQARNRLRQSRLTLRRSAAGLQAALVARVALTSLLPTS